MLCPLTPALPRRGEGVSAVLFASPRVRGEG